MALAGSMEPRSLIMLAQETELKLELTPEAADALIKSDLFPGTPVIARQRSIYFDTPERDLSAFGFSFRIRQTGQQRIQTVKAAGTSAAGLFARPEWERPVEDERPVLDDQTPIPALLGDKIRDVVPAFEVHVERRSWEITQDEAMIECALDRGEIVAGDQRVPICEIELELKRGAPSALFSLARRIDVVAPLRPGVLNKAERGYRLLVNASRAVKAETIILAADMTAAAAFQHIAGACLRQFRLNEALLDRRDGEVVHQARVALRRLRSAFSIHRSMAEDDAFQRLHEETRWMAAALGEARDLDVLIARCDVEAVRLKLEQAQTDAYDRAEAALASPRARALLLDLSEWIAVGGWLTMPSLEELREQPARDFAASALDRFRRTVKKGGRDLAKLDDPARHEVRKDAKKLRYATEFFASLFEGKRRKRRHKHFLDALEALQDHLGALNDLAVTASVLSRLGLDKEPGAVSLLATAEKRQKLIEAAAEAHDAFADAKRFWR
jgi:triphosphatase